MSAPFRSRRSRRPARAVLVPLVLAPLVLLTACAVESDVGQGAAGARRSPPPAGPFGRAFETRRESSAYGRPEGVTSGDVDGDGLRDVVVTTLSPPSLLVFLGMGEPEMLESTPLRVELAGFPLAPVVTVHGRVAVASRSTRTLSLFEASGGSLALLASFELGAVPRALSPHPAGGVVVACDDRLLAFSVEGAALAAQLPPERPTTLAVTDEGEWIVGLQASRDLLIFDSDALEGSAAPRRVPLSGIPRALVQHGRQLVVAGGENDVWFLDLDDRGDPPAIERRSSGGRIPVWAGVADETVVVVHDSSLTWTAQPLAGGEVSTGYCGQSPMSATLSDVDGDGQPDLLVANRDATCLSTCAGRRAIGSEASGRLDFASPERVWVGPGALSLAVWADANEPGAGSRAVVAHATTGTLSVVEPGSSGLVAVQEVSVGPSPRSVATADVDGDGYADAALLVQYSNEAHAVFLLSNGQGRLMRAPQLDVVVGKSGAQLLLTPGVGSPGAVDLIAVDGDGGRLLWVVDVGHPDARSSQVLECDGRPVAAAVGSFGAIRDTGAARVLAIGMATPEGGSKVVVRAWPPNDGLTPQFELAFDESIVDIVAADVDGVAPGELVVLTRRPPPARSGRVRVLGRTAETGDTLVTLAEVATGLDPRQLTIGDLDGDGWSELLVACRGSHDVGLLRLIPGPDDRWALQALRDLGADLGPMDAAIADFDGDGRVDILVTNVFSEALSWIRGRGLAER